MLAGTSIFLRLCLWFSAGAALFSAAAGAMQADGLWQAALMAAALGFALGLGALPGMKGYRYTAWIVAAVIAGMLYPAAFTQWGEVNLRNKWLILIIIQLVMFGMGLEMKLADFKGISSTGKGVLVGLLGHFTIMPTVGLLLTRIFHFEPEIAAGIILIGSCSSGLASNVMAYLARANILLSVVVTALATMVAPLLTPLLMKLLAGELVAVNVGDMMIEIFKIVIVPVGAAMLHDYLKNAPQRQKRIIHRLALVSLVWLAALPFGLWSFFETDLPTPGWLRVPELFSFLLAGFTLGIIYHNCQLKFPNLHRFMPYVSMFGIVYFTLVTTAAGRENLLKTGFLLFFCAVLHNAAGYFFGYWVSRLFRLSKKDARTVAFEVGLQNGGMASGIAGSMGKLGTLGLAAAVFSPWMNISGSILANYWRKKEEALLKQQAAGMD